MQLGQMAFADGGGVETAAGAEDTSNVTDGALPVGNVEEHVDGDDSVEGIGGEGDVLGVEAGEGKAITGIAERGACLGEHARRQIGESDVPF